MFCSIVLIQRIPTIITGRNVKQLWPGEVLVINEPSHDISNNVVCAASKGSDQPAHTGSLTRAFASRLNIV